MLGQPGGQDAGADQRRSPRAPELDARSMENPGRDGRMVGRETQPSHVTPKKKTTKTAQKKKWEPPAWNDGGGGVSTSSAEPATEPEPELHRPSRTKPQKKKKLKWEPPKWNSGDENAEPSLGQGPVAQNQMPVDARHSPPTELADGAASRPSPRPPSSPRTARSARGSAGRPPSGRKAAAGGDPRAAAAAAAAAAPKKRASVSASERQRQVQSNRERKDADTRQKLLERQARKHSSTGAKSHGGADGEPIAALQAELANPALSSAARYGLEKRLKTLKAAAARAARKKATGTSVSTSRSHPAANNNNNNNKKGGGNHEPAPAPAPPEAVAHRAPPPATAATVLAPLNEHSSPVLARRWSGSAAGAPPAACSPHESRRGSARASTERRGSSSLYAEPRGSPCAESYAESYTQRRSSGYGDHYADKSRKESHQGHARGRYGASAGGGSSFGGVGASAAPWGNSYSYAPGDEDPEC